MMADAGLLFVSTAFVAMAMLIEITWRVARVVVMRAGFFRLAASIAMTVLVEISRFVTRVIVMRARLLLGHGQLSLGQSREMQERRLSGNTRASARLSKTTGLRSI